MKINLISWKIEKNKFEINIVSFKSNSSLAFPELDSDVAGRLGTAEQFAVDGDRLVAHGEGHAEEGKGEHRNSQHPEISRKNQTKILSTKRADDKA